MSQQFRYQNQAHVFKAPAPLCPAVSKRSPSQTTRRSMGLSSSPADLTPSRPRSFETRYLGDVALAGSPLPSFSSKTRSGSSRPAASTSRTELRLPSSSASPNVHRTPSPEITPRAVPKFTSGCNIYVHEWRGNICVATYRCGDLLGQGGFAKVFDFVEVRTNERFACKIVEKEKLKAESTRSKFFAEVEIHQRLKHPNILNFIRYFDDEHHYYLLLERCCRFSLMDLHMSRGVFTVPEIQHIMSQLLVAADFLHNNLVIHRDLKLGNLMIDPFGNIKVGDFGFATQLRSAQEVKFTMCGTPNYIAPEVLKPEDPSNPLSGYSFEADIWSMGVILYTLAVGKPPFETTDVHATYRLIRKCSYAFPEGSLTEPSIPIPEGVKSMVSQMLCLNPRDRSSIFELRRHPFLATTPMVAPLSLQNLDTDISPHATGSPKYHSRHSLIPLRGLGGSANLRSNFREHPLSQEVHSTGNRLMPVSEPSHDGRVVEMAFVAKYGWFYRLIEKSGRMIVGVTLNDFTKVIQDERTSQMWYYSRCRSEDRQRDREYCFEDPAAAEAFARTEKGMEMGMPKKISILNYLRTHIDSGSDPNLQSMRTASAISTPPSRERYRSSSAEREARLFISPILAKQFSSFSSFNSLPPSVSLQATSIRFTTGCNQYVVHVMACGVDESIVLSNHGPCIAPWVVDFSYIKSVFELVFYSQVSRRFMKVGFLYDHLLEAERNGSNLDVEMMSIPSWLCSVMLTMVTSSLKR